MYLIQPLILVLSEFKLLERKYRSVGLFDTLVSPALAADGDITVVTADLNLLTLFDEVAVAVDAGIDDGLVTTCACALDFIYSIGDLEKPSGTLEEMALEISAETVAYHVAAEIVNDPRELIYLIGGEKLCLVDKKPVDDCHRLAEKLLCHFVEV